MVAIRLPGCQRLRVTETDIDDARGSTELLAVCGLPEREKPIGRQIMDMAKSQHWSIVIGETDPSDSAAAASLSDRLPSIVPDQVDQRRQSKGLSSSAPHRFCQQRLLLFIFRRQT